jgi:hypothetical protein
MAGAGGTGTTWAQPGSHRTGSSIRIGARRFRIHGFKCIFETLIETFLHSSDYIWRYVRLTFNPLVNLSRHVND